MAASPPPYPPPQDRRQQKEYWRAQKAAYRGQWDYWKTRQRDQRYYWRSMRRPSVVGPVVLLVIGVVALLITAGRLSAPEFWDWFVRWWPLVLVGIGLVSLLEWFLDRDQPYRRRNGSFGVILLISILVGIAYSQGHVHHLMNGLGIEGNNDWPGFMGEEHNHDADSVISIPAIASVQVQNPHGSVTITGSGDAKLHVHAREVVHTNSDSDAARTFSTLEPKVVVNGSSVLVRVEGRNNSYSDLVIELPEGAGTDITAGHGDVSIEGMNGATNISSGHGDVKVATLGGNVHVHMGKGDFSAHQVGGTVSLDGHLEDVTISEIGGGLFLDGDFFGDIHLEQIASTVHFHSSRTDLELARLAGELTMDDDDLHIGQAVGPLRLITRSKNIDCSQISGDVHIENANGDVSVTAVEPLGNIQINNASDPVTLTLPPAAGFTINAATDGGDLNTDFHLDVSGDEHHRSANGTVGKGGPRMEINARHGDISIKQGEMNPPPMPPIAPVPGVPKGPLPPPVPPRHLRVPKDVPPAPKVL